MSSPQLRPFFTYYGGKWRAAPRYPEPTGVIVEPFAGAAGYSVRHASAQVHLVEKSEAIAGVWRYLIGATVAEVMALPDIEPGQTVDDLNVSQEARWLIGMWLNKGVSAPRKSPGAWMNTDSRKACTYWGPLVRARIALQLHHIRHWTITHGDYTDAPDIEGTWYIDPPYQVAGKHYPHGAKAIDYAALGEWCRSRRGRVIVCENEGADWLPFEPFAAIKSTKGTSSEVIWTQNAAQPGLFR